jgi:hypothetical protein
MGAVKEHYAATIESAFLPTPVEMNSDTIYTADLAFDHIMMQANSMDAELQGLEQDWFASYHVDTADYLSDWAGRISAAVAVFTGLTTTDEGCVGNYFDMLAYTYHHTPRQVAKALKAFGLTDAVVQGIIYMLAGRLLDASEQLRIVKFEYLAR